MKNGMSATAERPRSEYCMTLVMEQVLEERGMAKMRAVGELSTVGDSRCEPLRRSVRKAIYMRVQTTYIDIHAISEEENVN